jgi:hypothetical protein
MCSCEDGEPVDVWVHEVRKARKQHRCTDCGGVIAVGVMHNYYRMLYDGIWSTDRRCSACDEKAEAFTIAEGCHAPIGALYETLRECASEDPDFIRNYLHARREVRAKRKAA